MKRLIIMLIIVATSFNVVSVSANNNLNDLKAIKVAPDNIKEQNINEAITRAQFARMAARLLRNEDATPVATRFNDVNETNEYSGYIEFLASLNIIDAESNNAFNPEGKVDLNMAYKILVTILGYDKIAQYSGGYPDGYVNTAMRLGLNKGMSGEDGYITNNDAITMFHNTLTTEIADVNISIKDGQYAFNTQSGNKKILLCDKLGISAYEGVVTKVNQAAHRATFLVEKNKYTRNGVVLNSGDEVIFNVDRNINIINFEKAPAVIWVNSDEKIINIILNNDVETKSGFIYSINGDTNKNNYYAINNINRLSIVDDETKYIVKEGAELRFNEVMKTSPVKLIGKFVKLVLIDDEIIFIESWDLTEGGLITNISDTDIEYIKGEQGTTKLRDFAYYEKKRVFINGVSVDEKELRPKSLFSFYKDDDTIVIIVSEKIIVDRLNSVSNSSVEIGNSFYNKNDIYYSTDGVNFKRNVIYKDFLNVLVEAYLTADGNVQYVKLSKSEPGTITEYFAIVSGIYEDLFRGSAKIEMWIVKPEVKKVIYETTSKTRLNDGLTLSEIAANVKDINGNGIYEFKVNDSGRITEISRTTPYFGFGEKAEATITTFVDDATSALVSIGAGKRMTYFDYSIPIYALYRKNDEFTVKQVAWSNLTGRAASGAKMIFYGEEMSAKPSYIVLGGNLETIGDKTITYGIITGKNEAVDDNGNRYFMLTVIEGSKTSKYMVTKELADSVSTYALISFYKNLEFSDNDIWIMSRLDLTARNDSWTTQEVDVGGLHKGVIDRIDGNRIYFVGGLAYFLHHQVNFCAGVYENTSRNRFSYMKVDEINLGDTVYYNLYSGRIAGIIVVK